MIDVYHATIDDFTWVALQSLFYFNYSKGGFSRTRPSQLELELHLPFRSGNSEHIVELLEKTTVDAGLNTKVLHLEEETIFGIAKRKLDLLPGDNNDSYHHDQENYSIPMMEKGMSLTQARNMLNVSTILSHSLTSRKSSIPLSLS